MNTPEGRVVEASGEFATVRVEAAIACARCAAGRGCGAGLLQKGRARTVKARIPADLYLEPGDLVRLELAPDHLLRAAWLAYGLPLLGAILAVGAASRFAGTGSELPVIACGLFGLVVGLMAGRRILQREGCLQHMTPVAAQRVPALPAVPPAAER